MLGFNLERGTALDKFLAIGLQHDLEILYTDQSLLAVAKPAGLLFHGYTNGLPTPLVDQVKKHIKQEQNKAGEAYLGVVHRLDRPVSGVSIFARNSKSARHLAAQFQNRTIEKIYLAVVEGIPLEEEAQLEDLLEAPPSNDGASSKKGPQPCFLSYRKLASFAGQSLLAIKLGSGRRHQIRMQLSHRNLPILGDKIYGAQTVISGTEDLDQRFSPIALHAAFLDLKHPKSQEPLRIDACLPWYWPPEFKINSAGQRYFARS